MLGKRDLEPALPGWGERDLEPSPGMTAEHLKPLLPGTTCTKLFGEVAGQFARGAILEEVLGPSQCEGWWSATCSRGLQDEQSITLMAEGATHARPNTHSPHAQEPKHQGQHLFAPWEDQDLERPR